MYAKSVLVTIVFATTVYSLPASQCPFNLSTQAVEPNVLPGYTATLVANGLLSPRGIGFDPKGNLIVVESGSGLSGLILEDHGGSCVGLKTKKTLVSDDTLNHGLAISTDGKTIYASSQEAAYSYPYDDLTVEANDRQRKTLVMNMTNPDHITRTLLLSKMVPGTLIISRGSGANIDVEAASKDSGHAQVRSFQLDSIDSPVSYTSGKILGWGLRNDVGVSEHPVTGGIWTTEASADQITRNGVDIHNNNPAEELNFLGYLNKDSVHNGGNFGYPTCFTAWDVAIIPDNSNIVPGSQFAIGDNVTTSQDKHCRSKFIAPRLALEPHMTPLDIIFNNAGSQAWISAHGSWDRVPTDGHKVCSVAFDQHTGEPVAPSTSKTACKEVFFYKDVANCSYLNCVRPVALAWDQKGRLFISSDQTGEIWLLTKKNGGGINE